METYYTKKEYNEMKSSLMRKIKELEKANKKAEEIIKKLQEDYNNLLITATEEE